MLNTYFSADGSISCIIDKNSSGLLYKENGWTCQNIKDLQIETDDKKKPGRITSIIFKSTDETRFTHLRFAAELSHGWFLYDNGVITFCGISIDWIDTFDGKLICLFFDFLDQTPSLFILSPKAPPPPVAPKPVSSLHSFVFSCLDKPTTA